MEATKNTIETRADYAEYDFLISSSENKIGYPRSSLSLEIGPTYIIWSVFRGTISPNKMTDSGLISEDNIVQPSRLYPHLDRIIETHGLQKAPINVYLGLPDGLLRCFYVPVVPKNEMEQVVKWEGRKVFPFDLDNAVFDWKIIGSNDWGGSKKYEIQAAAISRKGFMPIFNYFQERKLSVNWMTFTSLAWENFIKSRAAVRGSFSSGNFALVRLMGADLTVLFFQDHNLEFLRENSLEAGSMGGGFEESLHFLDATEGSRLSGIIDKDIIDYKAVAQTISDSLDYYHGQFAQRSIDRIFLSFPAPLMPAAIENIGRMIDLECLPAYADNKTRGLPENIPENLIQPSGFPLARKKSDLSLIPKEFQDTIKEQKRFKLALYMTAFLTIALLLISLMQSNEKSTVEKSVISMEADLESILNSEAFAGINKMQEDGAILRTQLGALSDSRHMESAILKALSVITPPDVRLTNLNLFREGDPSSKYTIGLFLSGFAQSSSEYPEVIIADYIKDLKRLPWVTKIELKNQDTKLYSGGKRVEFTLEMDVNR